MPEKLHNRTALVTGASSGIGAAIARDLARRGASLVLVARRAEVLETLAQELRQNGTTVTVRPTDLADPTARAALGADLASADHSRVDILVNNAGMSVYGPFAEAPWDRVRQMLEVNILEFGDEVAHSDLAHVDGFGVPACDNAHICDANHFEDQTQILRRNVPVADRRYVHYQPFFSSHDGALCGFEALARWTHVRRSSVAPARFHPAGRVVRTYRKDHTCRSRPGLRGRGSVARGLCHRCECIASAIQAR